MVFGIGEGKIEIILGKTNYSRGDTINGKAVLTLNSPKKAKELRLKFWGERNVKRGVKTHGPHGTSSATSANAKETVYEMDITLDGEKEYAGGEYQFQVKMPGLTEKKPENLVGEAKGLETVMGITMGVAQTLGVLPSPVMWYLQVSLNMPMSLDISKKVQINVV